MDLSELRRRQYLSKHLPGRDPKSPTPSARSVSRDGFIFLALSFPTSWYRC